MSHDPILDSISVIAHRTLVFILASIFQAMVIFWLIGNITNDPDQDTFFEWLEFASRRTLIIHSVFSLGIGVLNTSIIYIAIGNWWKSRTSVPHYRGARLEKEGD